MTTAGEFAAAAAGLEGTGDGANSRLRPVRVDGASRSAAHAGIRERDPQFALDATDPSRSYAIDADRESSGSAASQASAAAASAAGAAPAGLADPSVFSLTMSQAAPTGNLASIRSDMAAELATAAIDIPIDHAEFAEAFARHSAGFVVQGAGNAEIRLTPPDMGPIRIALSLDSDAVSLDIAAADPDTRAAIEASMPALRQMLAEQGMRLADWRLGNETASDRNQGAGSDSGRLYGEASAGTKDNNGADNASARHPGAGPPNGGSGITNGRATGPFNRHGSGWGDDNHQSGAVSSNRSADTGAGGGNRVDLYA